MLHFALCLFLTLGATKSSNKTVVAEKLRDDDLVTAVENTIAVCSGIAGHMGNFSKNIQGENARRRKKETDKLLVDGVGSKLDTCWKIFDAVNTGREEYCKGANHDQEDEIDISQPITFNVGGTLFSTNLTTLRSVEGTRF